MSHKKLIIIDLVFLIFQPVMAALLSILLRTNYLGTILLFYAIPSLYLTFRTSHKALRCFLFAIIAGVPMALLFDWFATVDGNWAITQTVFPFRLFNVITLENIPWLVLFAYFIIIFYEHFLDKGKHNLVDRRLKYFVWPLVILLIVFVVWIYLSPRTLVIPYAYFWFGIMLELLPVITFLSFFPRLLSKYMKVAVDFFAHSVIYEFTALKLNLWSYPGKNFIGLVDLFSFRFPVEEVFMWFILSSVAIISYFEFFDDDRK